MIKNFILTFALLCVLVTFAACADDDDTPSETESTTEATSDDAADTTEEAGVVKLSYSDIGLHISRTDMDDAKKAIATVTVNPLKAQVTITGVAEGSFDVRFYNAFNHISILKVDVDSQRKVTATFRTKSSQLDVMQYRYNGTTRLTDTNMIQAAIDAGHAKYKSTGKRQMVYVCPGEYQINYLQMKEGVTLKLYTTMTDATKGYTTELADAVKKKQVAIFKMSGRILNCPSGTYAYDCDTRSNFSIVGGVLDMNGTASCAMILGAADNVTLENIIFKDVKSGHAAQFAGSNDLTLRNCMFVGFRISESDSAFSAEMLQLEPSAESSSYDVKFEASQLNPCTGITIERCYFGKSDEYPAPLIAVGHHSQPHYGTIRYNVDALVIQNSVFEECRFSAIRFNSMEGMQILNS